MTSPHPKGPRIYRTLFEADRKHARSTVAIDRADIDSPSLLTVSLASAIGLVNLVEKSSFTISESPAMTQIQQNPRLAHSQGIDLTSFAGRVAPPVGVLGAGFDLPASYFSRLNATRPAAMPVPHPVELHSVHLSSMAAKS
jgi:hypothetical protein